MAIGYQIKLYEEGVDANTIFKNKMYSYNDESMRTINTPTPSPHRGGGGARPGAFDFISCSGSVAFDFEIATVSVRKTVLSIVNFTNNCAFGWGI
jgi:hypothetical protein